MDRGTGVAVMKLGTIGVQVRIIPPNAELPDDFQVYEDVDVEEFIEEPTGDVDELLADADAAMEGEGDVDPEEVTEAAEEFEDVPEPEFDDEEVIEEPDVPGGTDDEDDDEEGATDAADLDAVDEAIESEVDEEADAEAGDLMEEMEAAEDDADEDADDADADVDEADAADSDVSEADADEEVDEE